MKENLRYRKVRKTRKLEIQKTRGIGKNKDKGKLEIQENYKCRGKYRHRKINGKDLKIKTIRGQAFQS